MTDDHVTFEMISPIMRLSAYNTMIKNLQSVKLTWQRMHNMFSEMIFIENEFAYINPYNQKIMPIAAMLGKSFFKASEKTSEKYLKVQRDINYLLNKKTQMEKIASEKNIQIHVDEINDAIDKRRKHRRGKYRAYLDASDAICGLYQISATHSLRISNDPIDIFMKSTGQYWELESCERVGGQFESGIFSDIEWNNCIVFLHDMLQSHPIARVMVRWCNAQASKDWISFGIEPTWYSKYGKRINDTIDNFSNSKLRDHVISIIETKGFRMDYEWCVTPFYYRGYSDNEHQGQTRIKYKDAKRKYS